MISRTLVPGLALSLVLGLAVQSGCGAGSVTREESQPTVSDAAPAPAPGLPDRDPALACKLVKEQGALLLDVRSDAEFAEGHLDGAAHVPHDQIAGRLGEVGDDKNRPIVTYCRSGRRAHAAKQTLLDAGYTQVTNLGGMTDWKCP